MSVNRGVTHFAHLRSSEVLRPSQCCVNGVYVACVWQWTTIAVWPMDAVHLSPNVLPAVHGSEIVSMCFGVGSSSSGSVDGGVTLCASDGDTVVVYTLALGGVCHRYETVASGVGEHDLVRMCPRDRYIALVARGVVTVLDSHSRHVITHLNGHAGRVNMVEFSFCSDLLVTVSEDRTYVVWDFLTAEVLYQSSIHGTPFTCLAMDPNSDRIAVGSAGGSLSILLPPNYSDNQTVDISRGLARKNSAARGLDRSSNVTLPSNSSTILSLFFTMKPVTPGGVSTDVSPTSELLQWPHLLLVGIPSGVVVLNGLTLETLRFIDFASSVTSQSGDSGYLLGSCSSFSFMDVEGSLQMWCLVTSSEEPSAHLIMLDHPFNCEELGSPRDPNLSVVARSGPLYNSPFRKMVSKKPTIMAARVSLSRKNSNTVKASKTQDKPVTFKTSIKSSGYGPDSKHATRKMFTPQTSFGKKPPPVSLLHPKSAKNNPANVQKEYPMGGEPPTGLKTSIPADPTFSTVLHDLRFSPNGKTLAVASKNRVAHLFNMPLTGKGVACAGHNGAVNCVNWCSSSSRVVTASDDRSVKVWGADRGDLCLSIDTCSSGQVFPREVDWASFYYNNKLILASSGNRLYAFTYHIDLSKVSDINTYESKCWYEKIFEQQLNCISISSIHVVNSFLSYLVFIATSAKDLLIYDMNACKVIKTYEGCHERPVHCIRVNEGSQFSTQSADSFNLVATAAATDGIKLWDVRSRHCVRKYDSHVNRSHHCGFAWSPCGRFLAAGSEDRCSYLYDVTACTYVHKYPRFSDVVSCAAFHPLHPEVAFATNDGNLSLYSDRCRPNHRTPPSKTTRGGGARTPLGPGDVPRRGGGANDSSSPHASLVGDVRNEPEQMRTAVSDLL